MPSKTRLSDEVVEQIKFANSLIRKVGEPIEGIKLSLREVRRMSAAGRRTLAEFAEVDAGGNLTNLIDRAISAQISANSEMIIQRVTDIAKNENPSPIDYYEIYYNLLEDSGLLKYSLPDPGVLIRFLDKTGGFRGSFFDGEFNPVGGDNCSACTACNLCAACSACAVCTVSGVVATGVVGATSGTIGTGGALI